MSARITGPIETEIYTTEDGSVAIEQPDGMVVLISADQFRAVIRALQACFERLPHGKSDRWSKSDEARPPIASVGPEYLPSSPGAASIQCRVAVQ